MNMNSITADGVLLMVIGIYLMVPYRALNYKDDDQFTDSTRLWVSRICCTVSQPRLIAFATRATVEEAFSLNRLD